MRKLIITAFMTVALIAVTSGSAAYAVLGLSHVAASTTSTVQTHPVHVSHNGRAHRPGHTPLFMM